MANTGIRDFHVLERSKFTIQAFYDKDLDTVSRLLDDNFVYIGSLDSHYSHGKEEFLEVSPHENTQSPVHISDENYFILSHEGRLWTVCGRFTLSSRIDSVSILYARKRITMIWKEIDGQLKLLHIHCSIARDVPLEINYPSADDNQNNIRWFDYIRKFDIKSLDMEKIMMKDIQGNTQIIFPAEVFYAQSNGHYVTVFTADRSFDIRRSLKEVEGDSGKRHGGACKQVKIY